MALGDEPGVLVRGMPGDEVEQHPDAAVAGGGHELDHVVVRAVPRRDAEVVGDVVPGIDERRVEARVEPDGVDPQPRQVVEMLDDPAKVADAVTVGVREGLRIDLVDDRVPQPVGRHGESRSTRHAVASPMSPDSPVDGAEPEPVVQARLPALPELDRLRAHEPSAPEVGQRHVSALGVLLLQVGVPLLDLRPAVDDRGLPAGPGSEPRPVRPAGEVRQCLDAVDLLHTPDDDDLAVHREPGEHARGLWVRRQLLALA